MSKRWPKSKKGVCGVAGCGCTKLIKAPWNPARAPRTAAQARKVAATDRPALPGDGSLPVAVASGITPYANMGRFTKKQAAAAEKEFQKFLRIRKRNVKANIGKENTNE